MGARARLTYDRSAIRLLEEFVCVGYNHLYRPKDAESAFFLSLAEGGRHHLGNNFLVVTASGKVLKSGASAIRDGWKEWLRLPERERRAGAVDIEREITRDRMRGRPTPPPGGLVLRVYVRNLKRSASGDLELITRADTSDGQLYPWPGSRRTIFTEPMPDNMWMTRAEGESLVPNDPAEGDRLPVPAPVRRRLVRYHLVDNVYGLAASWRPEDIRREDLRLLVESTAPALRMRLEGSVRLESGTRGYDARLLGCVEYDPSLSKFTRFDIVAIGDVWGDERYKRPGRQPLGIAFELNPLKTPIDLVPPTGRNFSKRARRYFRAEDGR